MSPWNVLWWWSLQCWHCGDRRKTRHALSVAVESLGPRGALKVDRAAHTEGLWSLRSSKGGFDPAAFHGSLFQTGTEGCLCVIRFHHVNILFVKDSKWFSSCRWLLHAWYLVWLFQLFEFSNNSSTLACMYCLTVGSGGVEGCWV